MNVIRFNAAKIVKIFTNTPFMEKKFSSVKERILQIADYYGISKEKFFEELDITYGNFKGTAKDRPVNSSFLEKLLTKFPNVNPDWILLGTGEMLRNSSYVNAGSGQQVVANHNSGTINADNRQYYSDSPDVLRAQIDLLDERIKEKDAQIKEKDAQIAKLLEILSKQ